MQSNIVVKKQQFAVITSFRLSSLGFLITLGYLGQLGSTKGRGQALADATPLSANFRALTFRPFIMVSAVVVVNVDRSRALGRLPTSTEFITGRARGRRRVGGGGGRREGPLAELGQAGGKSGAASVGLK